MPRRLDHLVICVRDLAQAALDWQTLGFGLTPTGVHPFGTSNRLAMFANNFLELLAVTDAASVPPAAPDRFSFAAHNQDFLARAEGMSMLAMHSADAHADAARFKANHIGAYAPFDFGRDAVLPGGGTARVEFSLAFATDPAMPGIAFFTCQQRHPPELFWKPEYQHHPNGALRVIEVVMSAPEPVEHRGFLERITESTAELGPGRLTVGARGDRITVLGPSEMARRLPGLAVAPSPRFCAARLAVGDLDATKRTLKNNGVDFEIAGAVLLVPPAASHGLALEFVEQETICMPRIVSHNPASVHAPSSGYSMGLELSQHRRLLFVSGQVPEKPDGSVPEGFEAQCEQAWRNVIEVLAAAGLGVEHLVKITTFLTDRSQVVANRAIRRKMLAGNEPASTVMIAETVDGKWLLEIEAIAAE